ncbi:MAG: potassium channel family protein [Candidatus Methanofastidiosia archaeon]
MNGEDMSVVIVGAGHIGIFLIEHFHKREEKISVVEVSEKKCKEISFKYEAIVYNGSGDNPKILEYAETSSADKFIACTDDDTINLKACEHAKKDFGVPFVIAVSNSPKNVKKFEKVSNVVISPVDYVLDVFEDIVEHENINQIYTNKKETLKISKIRIPIDSHVIGKQIFEITRRGSTIPILYRRNIVIPDENTAIQANDILYLIGEESVVDMMIEDIIVF